MASICNVDKLDGMEYHTIM